MGPGSLNECSLGVGLWVATTCVEHFRLNPKLKEGMVAFITHGYSDYTSFGEFSAGAF